MAGAGAPHQHKLIIFCGPLWFEFALLSFDKSDHDEDCPIIKDKDCQKANKVI